MKKRTERNKKQNHRTIKLPPSTTTRGTFSQLDIFIHRDYFVISSNAFSCWARNVLLRFRRLTDKRTMSYSNYSLLLTCNEELHNGGSYIVVEVVIQPPLNVIPQICYILVIYVVCGLSSIPRCVNAVKLALDNENLAIDWKLKLNYVVGETTYKTALKEFDLNCVGRDTGNADVLSEQILKDSEEHEMNFLYPHGNLKMDILKNKFEGTNLSLNEIMVYETVPNNHIQKEFQDATNNFTDLPEYIVFFSPSGIKAAENVLKELPTKLIKMIAIGPTTEAAMIKSGLEVYGTAAKPTAQHVLDILL
ncbi:hypothetical protein Trydic_g11265 [Trypoxylus dichotomus]